MQQYIMPLLGRRTLIIYMATIIVGALGFGAVAAVEGVTSATVDLASGTVEVQGDAQAAKIIEAVTAAGYDCTAE